MFYRLKTLFTAVTIMLCAVLPMSVTAYAAKYEAKIFDLDDSLTYEQETELSALLAEAAELADCNIGVVITDDIMGMYPDAYTADMLNTTFGDESSSIMLLLCNDFDAEYNYDWIEMDGDAAEKYFDEFDNILAEVYIGLDKNGYAGAVESFCGYFGAASENNTDETPDKSGWQTELQDLDDVLTDKEEQELLAYMDLVAQDIECHVGVVITDDLNGMGDSEYADNFADESFGYGSDNIVILFCNDHIHYDWISAYGKATDMYEPLIDDIFDRVYDGLDSGGGNNYYSAIQYFCSYLRDNQTTASSGNYDDYYSDNNYYYEDDEDFSIGSLLIPAGISIAIAAIAVSSTASGYTKKKPVSARSYMDSNRTKYTNRSDVYLRETTTHVRISSSSSGSRGGGSRGGGGGRSRSGRSGGGGRRR